MIGGQTDVRRDSSGESHNDGEMMKDRLALDNQEVSQVDGSGTTMIGHGASHDVPGGQSDKRRNDPISNEGQFSYLRSAGI